MTVTATLHASTADEVAELGGCIHDSDFDWEEVRMDAEAREVTIPFAQEPIPAFNLPEPVLVGSKRRGRQIYRVPFYKGHLTVRHARRLGIGDDGRDDPGELTGLAFIPEREAIRAIASIGPEVIVEIDRIDVTLTMTDEIASERRRTVGRLGWERDVPWGD